MGHPRKIRWSPQEGAGGAPQEGAGRIPQEGAGGAPQEGTDGACCTDKWTTPGRIRWSTPGRSRWNPQAGAGGAPRKQQVEHSKKVQVEFPSRDWWSILYPKFIRPKVVWVSEVLVFWTIYIYIYITRHPGDGSHSKHRIHLFHDHPAHILLLILHNIFRPPVF